MLVPFLCVCVKLVTILGSLCVVIYKLFISSFNKIICEPIMYLAKQKKNKVHFLASQ